MSYLSARWCLVSEFLKVWRCGREEESRRGGEGLV